MTSGTFESPFPVEDREALAAQEQAYAGLAASVRQLVDACLRTRVAPGSAQELTDRLDAVTEALLAESQDGPLGLETCSDGRMRDHGNAMVGARNPLAPPLVIEWDGETATATGTLGPAYEGPPHHVHGGIIAAVLDQVLGDVPAALGRPGMTAYLNTTYERPTPLGPVSVRARLVAQDGWKMTVTGELVLPDGEVSARAEGLFVVPRWARQYVGTPTGDAGDFEAPAQS